MPGPTPIAPTLISLDDVRIATPCHADWDLMRGDDKSRFCQSCEKNVYNLSEMTRAEAEALVRAKEGDMCARLYLRQDGTIITQDCPVGQAPRRTPWSHFAAAGAGIMALLAGFLTTPPVEAATRGKSRRVSHSLRSKHQHRARLKNRKAKPRKKPVVAECYATISGGMVNMQAIDPPKIISAGNVRSPLDNVIPPSIREGASIPKVSLEVMSTPTKPPGSDQKEWVNFPTQPAAPSQPIAIIHPTQPPAGDQDP